MDEIKIGLALGGGGARGLSHLGVLKTLTNAGIPIHAISGTSIGGIIGAFFASGMSIEEIENIILRFTDIKELMKLIDLTTPRRGLLDGSHVKRFVREHIPENLLFEDLHIPLSLTSVDLLTASEITYSRGYVLPALYATFAVPGVFPPVELDGYQLVDGGVLNNVPVNHPRGLGATHVIAVNVHPKTFYSSSETGLSIPRMLPSFIPDSVQAFYQAELIMVAEMTRLQFLNAPPDIIIHPDIPSDISIFMGFHRGKELIAYGEAAAQQVLPEIEQLLGK